MVLTHLTRALGYPLPLIYHRNHWFPEKNAFADYLTQFWQLEVHDWPPAECGVKVHEYVSGPAGAAGTDDTGVIQTVSRYQISTARGVGGMDVPNGILDPEEGKPFLCAVTDILARPKAIILHHPWDLYLSGHKGSDKDIFEGPCPLRCDYQEIQGGPSIAFPLIEWNDDDVWDYIDEFNVPIQTTRYDVANHTELPDKRFNNDYVHACTRCIDRRQPGTVYCPKLNREIPNVSDRVKDMEQREVAYIDR